MDRMMRDVEVAELLAISRAELQRWRCQGRGPVFVRNGSRCIRYRLSDVQAWIAAQPGQRMAAEAREAQRGVA